MEIDLELYRRDVLLSTAPRLRLSVIDAGPPDADETLVFIHGFGGQSLQWARQVHHFAQRRRCIALDLRGHGLSDGPQSVYSMDELVGDIDAALTLLRVNRPFTLFGHSFGGWVAASYAVAHPDAVDRLVFVCVPHTFRLPGPLKLGLRLPTPWLNLIRERLRLYAPAHVLQRMYTQTVERWDGDAVLPRITAPTLVLVGQRDRTYPQSSYRAVGKLVPVSQLVIVPAAPHLMQLERPDATNRAIERFIDIKPITWREADHPRPAAPIWTHAYDPHVPTDLRLPEQPLHRFLECAARRRPDRPAVLYNGGRLTYRDIDGQANRLAHALLQRGLVKGERVLMALPNSPQAVVALYGAHKAGAVVAPANPEASVDELAFLLQDSGAAFAIVRTEQVPRLLEAATGTGLRRVVVTDMMEDLAHRWGRPAPGASLAAVDGDKHDRLLVETLPALLAGMPDEAPEVIVWADDLACIQYTSGTTGAPKGVMLSHMNLIANTIQMRLWAPGLKYGEETFLCAVPFWHIYGLLAGLSVPVSRAAALVIPAGFDVGAVLQAVKRHRPTLVSGVPALYMALRDYPGVRAFGLSHARACLSNLAPLPIEVQEAVEWLTRGRLVEGYGLTEAAAMTHANPLGAYRRVGWVGLPLPSTEAKIVDLVTGADLPPGEYGELCVRGPQVMLGYWGRPTATAQALRDGWLYTGDVARMDEKGYFQVVERKSNVWFVAGRRGQGLVLPRHVEEVLFEHPKVQDVAVVRVDRDAPTLQAFVVLKQGESATPAEMIDYARQRADDAMVLDRVTFIPALPRNAVGKVLRRLLEEGEMKT